jgi:hypothetical protein
MWTLRTDMDPGAGYWPLQNRWADQLGKFKVLTVFNYGHPESEMKLWGFYGGNDQKFSVVGVA